MELMLVEGVADSVGWSASAVRKPGAPTPSRLRVATIDGDSRFIQMLASCFKRLDWTLIVYPRPVISTTLIGGRPHAVLLDIELCGAHWEEWIARQSERLPHLGVLVCTQRSTAGQRIRGLRAGADDWITKPCHPEEVMARLQAIVRGHRLQLSSDAQVPLNKGELEICPDQFEAFANGRAAELTSREFDILLYLARNAGTVIEREHLYLEVWGYAMVRGSRTVDTFVRKIRTKLEVISPGWRYIHTQKGLGYSFLESPVERVQKAQGMRTARRVGNG